MKFDEVFSFLANFQEIIQYLQINLKEKLLFEYFDVPEALIAEFFRKKIVSLVNLFFLYT